MTHAPSNAASAEVTAIDTDARVPLLLAANIPFVTLGRSEGPDHAWIELDFEGVAEQSVNRLVTRGHRDIAVALPANDLNLGNLFLAGYRKALQAHGIAFRPDWAIRTESSEQGGYRLGTELLSLEQRPTAVMLSYEQPAGGLYRRLNESDLPPGPGIAVIGFRDSQQTRHLVPRLTSFTTSLKDLGMALGETLLSRMPATAKEYADRPPTMIWPLTLVPGDSDPFLNPGAR